MRAAKGPNGGEGSGRGCVRRDRARLRRSGAAGPIEVELGGGLWVGWIERGRLVRVVGGQGIHLGVGIGVELGCGLGLTAGRAEVLGLAVDDVSCSVREAWLRAALGPQPRH